MNRIIKDVSNAMIGQFLENTPENQKNDNLQYEMVIDVILSKFGKNTNMETLISEFNTRYEQSSTIAFSYPGIALLYIKFIKFLCARYLEDQLEAFQHGEIIDILYHHINVLIHDGKVITFDCEGAVKDIFEKYHQLKLSSSIQQVFDSSIEKDLLIRYYDNYKELIRQAQNAFSDLSFQFVDIPPSLSANF